jgi:hypothetical protein
MLYKFRAFAGDSRHHALTGASGDRTWGGGMGAALLTLALKKKWVNADIDSRALSITARGRRAMRQHFGANIQAGRKLDP